MFPLRCLNLADIKQIFYSFKTVLKKVRFLFFLFIVGLVTKRERERD